MNMTVLSFGKIQELVSNLGWMDQNNTYVLGSDCLMALQNLEDALLNEDVTNRNVRISLHTCEIVKNDLIPILIQEKDAKILAVAIRVLVSLSLPVECLLPLEDSENGPKTQNVRKKLLFASLAIKRDFLDISASLSLVTMLRESMIRSEKHSIPLKDDDCNHLKNCLILLRNLLHLPEDMKTVNKHSRPYISDLKCLQKKLIWNLFVQGIDGALLLMLNSKYRTHWSVPLSLILALLYKSQNISKVHQTLELISSASESSGEDEESDGSKNSSTSLSSEPSKCMYINDSGYLTSDTTTPITSDLLNHPSQDETFNFDYNGMDIQTKLERFKLADDGRDLSNFTQANISNPFDGKIKNNDSSQSHFNRGNESERSSSSESPHNKKRKSNISSKEDVSMMECTNGDSGLSESIEKSPPDSPEKSSDDDVFRDKKSLKNLKAIHKLRCAHIHSQVLESDSSNEDLKKRKTKYRSHPPVGWRGKSPRRNDGCNPSICMDSAVAESCSKGRMRYPLWEKRNSVSTLVDIKSVVPNDDDLRILLKEFTLSFMHSGFSQLILDLKKLLLEEHSPAVDKSLFFWLISYFLRLAATLHINFDHISDIISADVISYLVYECVLACENVELESTANKKVTNYVRLHLSLLVSAVKEVINTVDLYSRKMSSQKEMAYFNELCGTIAGLQNLRHIPLLLFYNCPKINSNRYIEDVIVLNHHILTISERGSSYCLETNRINLTLHLKLFCNQTVLKSYGKILQNFKTNSKFLNECVFTMLHHVAGDIHSSHLLLEPTILKIFSSILQEEDLELEQYQEDLILYILNKFSFQRKRQIIKESVTSSHGSDSSEDSTSTNSIVSSVVSSSCFLSQVDDDLFWWYLQFEQDKDPISRISEHFPLSKYDILSKLLIKGIVSLEKYQNLEETMKNNDPHITPAEELVHIANFDDDITQLLRTLVQSGARQHLTWLQDILLETCYVKLGLDRHFPEPVSLYSVKMMLSVPLVPYTEEQRLILQDEVFLQLLQKIGFHLGSGVCQMYPRIPLFWNTSSLFTIAARLGPIRKDKLKFTYEDFMMANPNHESVAVQSNPCPALPPLSSCCTLSSWLTAVQQSKENYRAYKLNNGTL